MREYENSTKSLEILKFYHLESFRLFNFRTSQFLQAGISGTTYEGGCPFKDFDVDILKKFLHTLLTKDETEKLLNNTAIQSPEMLCTGFLKLVCKDKTDNVTINSPVQFYQKMVG